MFDAHFSDFGRFDACIDIQVAERIINAVNTENNETRTINIPAFNGKYSRVYTHFSPVKLLQRHENRRESEIFHDASSLMEKPIENWINREWNVSIEIEGQDKLTDHKDFGVDFASLNITSVLEQDFILVRDIL